MSRLSFLICFGLGLAFGLWVRVRWLQPALLDASGETGAGDDDDLMAVVGIGPAFAQVLQDAGIRTLEQLARQDADKLAAQLGQRVPAERIKRERWIEQARELSRTQR